MGEQLARVGPAVALKLPDLAGGEDGDDALPVVGLEVLGAVDEDEAQRGAGGDGGHGARRVQDVAGGAGAARGLELARLEERLDVGHAQEGRGRGREQDDGLEPARRCRCGFLEP